MRAPLDIKGAEVSDTLDGQFCLVARARPGLKTESVRSRQGRAGRIHTLNSAADGRQRIGVSPSSPPVPAHCVVREQLVEKDKAASLVPAEMLANTNLVGPASYVKERIAAYKEAGVTHLSVNPVGADSTAMIEQLRELID